MCSFEETEACSEPDGTYAGVVCGMLRWNQVMTGYMTEFFFPPDFKLSSVEAQVRLFGSGLFDSERAVGVVEVFIDNRWGVVCNNEAEEVARANAGFLCRKFFNDGGSNDPRPIRIPVAR
jgi:hypothetical protein